MYQHILIPTDGSKLAHRAVTHRLSLAKAGGAKVTALVVEPTFNVYGVPSSKVHQMCQSALEWDPLSAFKRDPFERRVLTVALAPSELVGVAETARVRAV